MKRLALLFSLTFSVCPVFGQNINVSNASVFEGEPYLAIDPANPSHLVAAWMGFKLGEELVIKTSYSDNYGETWSTPASFSHEVAGNTSADVSLKYDGNGNLFACYIDYDNDTFANGAIFVRKSVDGGQTWGPSVEVINTITDCPGKLCVDRPWMAIDNSGGSNDGTIYVTSMNADQDASPVSPPYNPYLAVSSDGGASFGTPRFLDTTDFLAGPNIKQPMPSPTVDANGTFYATYPSYDTGQSPFAHVYLAKSTNKGVSLSHTNAYTVMIAGISDPFAKKGGLLISDPSTPDHLAMFLLGEENGDGDIYLLETLDGISWTTPARINQDPIGNGRLQDLVWASFNESGDLAVCWRDRRNAPSTGYQTDTEIFAAIRFKDSANFEPDFAISSQQVAHNVVLEGSGNDFQNVQFVGDTMYTVWGDVRTGTVNIFLNKTNVITGTSSLSEISSESPITIYPNPARESLTISDFDELDRPELINELGEVIKIIEEPVTDVSDLPRGSYFIRMEIGNKAFLSPVILQ